MRLVLLILIAFLFTQCAHKVAPSGGPEDKTPPVLVQTEPDSFQVKVPRSAAIRLIFSEKLQESSVSEQVWIIPEPSNGIQVTVKKNRIMIQPRDSLLPDLTYQVIVGTGVKDRHGNPLRQPVQLIFSTGETIDSARIEGQVLLDGSSEHWVILAHAFRNEAPESLLFRKAAYFLPLAQNGSFRLGALRYGSYFVYGLNDANGDRQYQVGEAVAFPPFPVFLTDQQPDFRRLVLKPVREDMQAPHLRAVQAVNARRILLEFDEAVGCSPSARVELIDSLRQTQLGILGVSRNPDNEQQILIFTESQQNDVYNGWITGLCDTSGNSTDTLHLRFTGTAQPDTIPPAVVHTRPEHGAEDVPYHATIQITFSQPVDTATVPASIFLLTGKKDTVSGRWDFQNFLQPIFRPDSILAKGASYQIVVNEGTLKTLWGDQFGDSVRIYSFTTIDWAELGEIEGTVECPDSLKGAPIVVEAVAVQSRQLAGQSVADSTGAFLIPFLPEGQYTLQAFVDRNKNGRWDGGRSVPFRWAEPITVNPDLLRVRKRWTTQGATIRFY